MGYLVQQGPNAEVPRLADRLLAVLLDAFPALQYKREVRRRTRMPCRPGVGCLLWVGQSSMLVLSPLVLDAPCAMHALIEGVAQKCSTPTILAAGAGRNVCGG